MKRAILILCILLWGAQAKTRWGAARIIPTADFLGAGEFVVGYDFQLKRDSTGKYNYTHMVPLQLSLSEWLNVSTTWNGEGFSFGFKGRILDEYTKKMPSVAVGVRELYYSTMRGRSNLESRAPEHTSEIFIAASKSYEPITTRFHLGFQSLPNSRTEKFNVFVGVEKYMGQDFYLTLEGWSLREEFNLALFFTSRFLKSRRAELVVGLVDLEDLLFDEQHDLDMDLKSDAASDWVKPAITVNFNYAIPFGFGKRAAFRTLEDLYGRNKKDIDQLKDDLDALKIQLNSSAVASSELRTKVDSLKTVINNMDTLPELYETVYSLLVEYRGAYQAEPLDIVKIKQIREEILSLEKTGEEVMQFIVGFDDTPRSIKITAVSLLGLQKVEDAVDLLLEELSETRDSKYKVEIITALGVINDRSVSYAIKHLAESNDAPVAIAAREVLNMWSTNVPTEKDEKKLPVTDSKRDKLEKSKDDFLIEDETN